MTHLVDKNAPERGGNGRIRRTLPALGLIAAAISGYNAQTGGALPLNEPERVSVVVTPPMIAQEATLLHFARAQGVGDAIREAGTLMPDRLEESLRTAATIVEEGRTGETAYRIDMAYSAGYLDGSEGGWSAERLDGYVTRALMTEIGLLELADQATLRWAGTFGLEEGRALVTGAMAMAVMSDPFEPIWSGPVDEPPQRGIAFIEVSGAVREMLSALEEAAYLPPFPATMVEVGCTVARTSSDLPPPDVCAMEI